MADQGITALRTTATLFLGGFLFMGLLAAVGAHGSALAEEPDTRIESIAFAPDEGVTGLSEAK